MDPAVGAEGSVGGERKFSGCAGSRRGGRTALLEPPLVAMARGPEASAACGQAGAVRSGTMARDRAENAVIPGRTVSGVACSSGTPEPRREQQAAGGAGKGRTRGWASPGPGGGVAASRRRHVGGAGGARGLPEVVARAHCVGNGGASDSWRCPSAAERRSWRHVQRRSANGTLTFGHKSTKSPSSAVKRRQQRC